MAENESFFRKVVRFVANPATDWTDLSSRQEDNRELELEKSELKAMIERKRRNDFVRKREFDMLRRVRREGLSPEQLAALGTSSRLDDSESRPTEVPAARTVGVKAKIDEIEQQMVGDHSTRGRGTYMGAGPISQHPRYATTEPLPHSASGGLNSAAQSRAGREGGVVVDGYLPSRTGLPPLPAAAGSPYPYPYPTQAPAPTLHDGFVPPAAAAAPVQMSNGLPPLAPPFVPPGEHAPEAPKPAVPSTLASDFDPFSGAAVEVSEVVHDPDLDEAVIAFANADFTQCEDALRNLTAPGAIREHHAETWLVLFDLYRATNQQHRFESLAMDYAQQFGSSAPQWYSLPQLVADAAAASALAADDGPALRKRTASLAASIAGQTARAAAQTPQTPQTSGWSEAPASPNAFGADPAAPAPFNPPLEVGWVCPDLLDIDAVAHLRAQTLQLPLPWVLDWAGVKRVDPEAAMQLSTLFRLWSGQALDMRWLNGNQLFAVLQEAAPTGMRDADPVFWLARLDGLRLANRATQFDETAIDYCVTYEVSPPSWEPARCKVQILEDGHSTRTPPLSGISGMSTSFMESHLVEDGGVQVAHIELSGQLVGDISATLAQAQANMSISAPIVSILCQRLIRVDFIAAGDLLNWVLARRNEQRTVHFVEAHRLVALFFGAMGINEHAKVQVRKV
jgi:hypothetical protein